MASLFNDLPSPTNDGSETHQVIETDDDYNQIKEPSAKRSKTEPASQPHDDEDQVSHALKKIAHHIQHKKKFLKASHLLRQLLSSSNTTSITPCIHAPLIFNALASSMTHPTNACDPELSMEYSRLFTAASACRNILDQLTQAQCNQLDIYGIWAVLRNKLATTDDPYALTKVVKELKSIIENTPEISIASDSHKDIAPIEKKQKRAEEEVAPAPRPETDSLDVVVVWNEEESMAYQRRALIDCILACREIYSKPWARSIVDLFIDSLHVYKGRFEPDQRKSIDAMAVFVKEQRILRRNGLTDKESKNEYMTSYERASSDWGKADVSARGKVGNQ